MITLRALGADDGSVWQGLFASVAAEGRWIGAEAPAPDRSQEIVDEYLDRADRALLLAEVDGTPVGWITGDLDVAGSVEIGMGIVADFRRRGIGTAMVEAVASWAVERGAERLRLDVFPHNDAAIGLYAKLGFVEVGRHERAWRRRSGERWDLIAMERSL